ncbi:hypothetical protein B0H99_11448 [Planomicrobium soli]|uniref:Uncharacterized protein n=1 Tax=Planomicrobium soli TaxID=1176648 RepID=A0A2P8G6Z3_9BACL|nr:hypothetical protein B0H99_11448 [Planomicrobium soli]
MDQVFTESRYRWKPVILPLMTSPPSGVLKGSHRLGIPGGHLIRSSLPADKLTYP